jgi:hypothetical protein
MNLEQYTAQSEFVESAVVASRTLRGASREKVDSTPLIRWKESGWLIAAFFARAGSFSFALSPWPLYPFVFFHLRN